MSALQALIQVFTAGLGGSARGSALALVSALLALALVYGHFVGVVPRLAPRMAAGASAALALSLVAASWLLRWGGVLDWPVLPALVALVFGHLGIRQAGLVRRMPVKLPPRAVTRMAPAVKAPLPETQSPPAGQAPDRATLGRYRIDRQLGRGAMGAVYLGHDPKIGRQVAIKTMALSQEFDGDELAEARVRFFREAETAGRLQHRDIVTIFDAGEDNDLAYIAMEFLRGHDLQRYTRIDHLLPVPVVLRTVARVAEALAYAHSQGVVHRDIKPANVMIDPQTDSVKVTDFGIARITDSSRTRTGVVLGTPSFMSPEQMAGLRVDAPSDLYSLGVMLFQLLTGRLPHQAESMAKLMYQIANEPAPDLRSLRSELPEALASVVARSLEKRPDQRYADGRQMAAELRKIAAALGPQVVAAPQAAAAIPPESSEFAATVKISRTDPGHNSTP